MVIWEPTRKITLCGTSVFDPFQGRTLGKSQCNQQSGDFNKSPPSHPLCSTFAQLPLKQGLSAHSLHCEGGARPVSAGGSASFPAPPAPALSWDLPAVGARRLAGRDGQAPAAPAWPRNAWWCPARPAALQPAPGRPARGGLCGAGAAGPYQRRADIPTGLPLSSARPAPRGTAQGEWPLPAAVTTRTWGRGRRRLPLCPCAHCQGPSGEFPPVPWGCHLEGGRGAWWHTCPKGLSSVLEAGKEWGVGQHGGSLSNRRCRGALACWRRLSGKGRACIVWVLQEADRGYLGSCARDTDIFVFLGLKTCQSVS